MVKIVWTDAISRLAKGGNGHIQATPWDLAATGSVDEANIQKRLNINTRQERTRTYCTDTGEEIMPAVSRPKEEKTTN